MQFLSLFYHPLQHIPTQFAVQIPSTQSNLEAGNELINVMTQIEGDIFLFSHGYLPALAGKTTHAHRVAVEDVLRGNEEQAKANLINEIRRAIRQKRFGAIILDSDWLLEIVDLEQYYEGPIFNPDIGVSPYTGKSTRPRFIYTPKSSDTD